MSGRIRSPWKALRPPLPRGRNLAVLPPRILHFATFDQLFVANQGARDRGVLPPHAPAEDAVGNRAALDGAAGLDRDIGPERRIPEAHAVFDVHGILDLHAGWHFRRSLAATVFEEMLIRFEQRVHLAAVVPAAHLAHEQLLSFIHHVLERVGQIELAALPGGALDDVLDPFEQRPPILDRKSTRLNSSHSQTSYAVFCLKIKSYSP